MVKLKRYEKNVEEIYWECVSEEFDLTEQQDIVASCKKYMPREFFSENACFRELLLAPFDKIKCAYQFIEKNKTAMESECFIINNEGKRVREHKYNKLYYKYHKVSQKLINGGWKMNVFLAQQTGLSVCPYCNRNYINSRSNKLAGAQMDHFYPRSNYPVFSLSLYNLVPVCGNCNSIKRDNKQEFASPFDSQIDWDNDLRFSYTLLDMNRKKIVINAKGPVMHNIKQMHIQEAYQIHEMELNELLDKAKMYSATQMAEFQKVFDNTELTQQDLHKMVFGSPITEEGMKKRPLGRMIRDLERELGIY